jgi:hypothetical protein
MAVQIFYFNLFIFRALFSLHVMCMEISMQVSECVRSPSDVTGWVAKTALPRTEAEKSTNYIYWLTG